MPTLIMTDRYNDSRKIAEHFKASWALAYGDAKMRQDHIDRSSCPRSVQIAVWDDDRAPEIKGSGYTMLFYNPHKGVDSFIADLERHFDQVKTAAKENGEALMAQFSHVLDIELEEKPFDWFLNLRYRSASTSLIASDLGNAKDRLKRAQEYQLAVINLSNLYPNLHFGAGSVDGANCLGSFSAAPMSVWVSRDKNGIPTDAEATGFSFMYPPIESEHEELNQLQAEAEKAVQPGFFFCTKCRTAHPEKAFGGFHFAAKRCKSCATPDWKKMAAKETYN